MKEKKTLIRLENLKKDYEMAGSSFTALRDINLKFCQGEFIGIVGKSGSGKSTMMNMITGIDRPTEGNVEVDDKIITGMSENDMAKWRGINVGIVFQFFQLLPTLTILENLMLPMDFTGQIPKKERKNRAYMLLDMVDIKDQAHKFPSTLSGGQQQRAAIARALANDPKLVVADEPTGNLDSKTAEAVMDIFRKLTASGKTVIIVSHDKDIEVHCDRIVKLKDGEVLSEMADLEGSGDYAKLEMV